MYQKKIQTILIVVVMALLLVPTSAAFAARGGEGGRGNGPVIYVRSQGLYFDSIVAADPLPWKGKFQKLEIGSHGLETNFGPSDVGYKGGRWWLDANGNGIQDANDHYFSCPLLGPGRDTP
jgi:hypothetical protein